MAQLEVYWPTTDKTQVFEDLAADQAIEIVEGDANFRVIQTL